MAAAAGTITAPATAPAAQGVSGLDVFRTNCDGCHDLPDPERPKRTRAEWEAVLQKMVKEKGASLNKQEFAAVLDYLDSFNVVHRAVAWNDKPAAAHRFAFDTAPSGPAPDPWVNLTVGAPGENPWTLQRDPAGKSGFLTPRGAVGEGQTQLLLDNSGILTAGTIATRLRLPTGKGAGGAGIVFGFRSPLSFFGLRLNPVSKDLVLYDVDQGERALLGRAPFAVPAGQPVTLAVTLSPKQVQVAVNGKPAVTRPLTGYRGGRAGLAAEGPALPTFDQWSIELSAP
jgi:hypothetical protein